MTTTRAPDPADPQPGDRFVCEDDRQVRTITAVGVTAALVSVNDDPWEYRVPLDRIREYRPVPPPLVTEPTTLYLYRRSEGGFWLDTLHFYTDDELWTVAPSGDGGYTLTPKESS